MSSDPVLAYHNEAFLDSADGRPLGVRSSGFPTHVLLHLGFGKLMNQQLELGLYPLGGPERIPA